MKKCWATTYSNFNLSCHLESGWCLKKSSKAILETWERAVDQLVWFFFHQICCILPEGLTIIRLIENICRKALWQWNEMPFYFYNVASALLIYIFISILKGMLLKWWCNLIVCCSWLNLGPKLFFFPSSFKSKNQCHNNLWPWSLNLTASLFLLEVSQFLVW